MYDTNEVEYIEAAAALKERNTAQKEELTQARAAAKIDKDRVAILAHLSDDKQEFTREDLNNWGFSNNVITRLKKSTIKKVRVKTYVLQDA